MGIYSANRSGSMTLAQVACNENYRPSDLATVMYESTVNDQRVFEAVLACDFMEIHSLREGTLLEAEVEESNKRSAKQLLASLKDRLAKFWAKIKNAFHVAIQKISAYILKDGKAFAADFRAAYKKKGAEYAPTGDKMITYSAPTSFQMVVPDVSECEAKIRAGKNSGDRLKAKDIIEVELGAAIGEASCSSTEFAKKVMEKAFATKELKAADFDNMLTIIENASEAIKALRSNEKDTQRKLSGLEKSLKSAEKDLEKTKETGTIIHNITVLCSAYETIVSCTTRASIKIVQTTVKSYRTALQRALGTIKAADKTVSESAAIVAGDEFDDAVNPAPSTVDIPITNETQEEIDQLVAAADADIAAECGKGC